MSDNKITIDNFTDILLNLEKLAVQTFTTDASFILHDIPILAEEIYRDNNYHVDLSISKLYFNTDKFHFLKQHINLLFDKLFLFSNQNNFFFRFCSYTVYKETFNVRFEDYQKIYVDTELMDFVKLEINYLTGNNHTNIANLLNEVNKKRLLDSAEKKWIFLEKLFDAPDNEKNVINLKKNKSLLFEGKGLNLSERYKIANKVLNIDKVIRKLNIKDLEKYQLVAHILGCDKDNARHLCNGTYKSKDRDLSQYFKDLDLTE